MAKRVKKDTNIVDAKNLAVYRELDVAAEMMAIRDFVDHYMRTTVRDNTVQREAVWELLRKMGYISGAVVGRAKLTGLHLVDLRACYELAEKKNEHVFADHLWTFINDGYLYCHIDGGNRCDALLEFFDKALNDADQITLEPAYYQFLPDENHPEGQTITVNRKDVTWKTLWEKNEEGDYINPEWATLGERLLSEEVCVYLYKDLNQTERADLFDILNNGINLNAAELRNRLVSLICGGIRDNLNVKYKKLFVKVGVLTTNDSKRWGFCEYLAKLNNLWMTKALEVPVWGSKTDLDNNYKPNSAADSNYMNFEAWFERKFLPYVKLFDKHPRWKFANKNCWVDLFNILCYMDSNHMKLKNEDSKGREDFIRAFWTWETELLASKKLYDCGAKGKRTWDKLFSNNSDYVLKHRTKMSRKFVKKCLAEGLIVKLDTQRLYEKKQSAGFAVSQNFKTPKGKEIDVMEWANPDLYAPDHIEEHAHGGQTTTINGELIEKSENLLKEVERKKARAEEVRQTEIA